MGGGVFASGADAEATLASAVLEGAFFAALGVVEVALVAADFDVISLAAIGATGAALATEGFSGAALVCGAWFASMNLRTRGRMLLRQLFPAKIP